MAGASSAMPTQQAAWSSCLSKIASGEVPCQADLAPLYPADLIELLVDLVGEQFEVHLENLLVNKFWERLRTCQLNPGCIDTVLRGALQELSSAVQQQIVQLDSLVQNLLSGILQYHQEQQQQWHLETRDVEVPASTIALLTGLCRRYRTAVASIIMATAKSSLPDLLQQYYKERLRELCNIIQQQQEELDAAADSTDDVDAMIEDAAMGSDAQGQKRLGDPAATCPDPLSLLGPAWSSEVSAVCSCMETLGLAAASEEAYTTVINSYVLQQLCNLASGELDTAVLPRAQQLVCAAPLAFLRLVLQPGQDVELKLQEWQLRLTYLMLETLGALRSENMFDIVIDYPYSAPALHDLAVCLQHTNMASQFAATFRSSLQQRLLHAGAATSDIIHTYVSTIKAMKQVDQSGLLLDLVSEPIRIYLCSRPDTIRCIVALLTEDTTDPATGTMSSSLLEELQEQQQLSQGPSGALAPAHIGGKESKYNWCVSEAEGDEAAIRLLESLESGLEPAADPSAEQARQPELLGLPVYGPAAAPAAVVGARADADVVSMLIGIFGGPLLFMEEYRNMLSERLLAKDEYDCEREVRTLELLKIRFGEAGLHPCEVMLKDLADSKRLDANVRDLPRQQALQQQAVQQLPAHVETALAHTRATICSYLFWPELPKHEMVLPAELHEALQVYAERFRHLKAPRKLRWLHTVGLVELSVSIGESDPIDFKVTPVHAALLMQFAADPPADSHLQGDTTAQVLTKTATQLSAALGVPVPVIRKKAMFWVSAGVLLERRGAAGEVTYSRATSIDPSRIVSREITDLSWQEDTGGLRSAEDRIIAEMGPYENYIVGLLTNCGMLSLERLHNMLRVFVVGEPKYEGKSQEQLAAFLQIMVTNGKIDLNNGIYSKAKVAAQA